MLVHTSDLSTKQKYQRFIAITRMVPAGNVATYSQVAFMADLPGRARMVGKALGCILASSDTPWHRIIRADGRVAFAAETIQFTEQCERLQNEAVIVKQGRINLRHFQWAPDMDDFLTTFSSELKKVISGSRE
ncbi:MAG: MGMT family protein [Pseudomonadota bacterium]